jgi:hypothetical protein
MRKSEEIQAGAQRVLDEGDKEYADLLAAVAKAVAFVERGPISTQEVLRWSGVVEHALRASRRRIGTGVPSDKGGTGKPAD